MKLKVKFTEQDQTFVPNFGEVNNISDGGYERGYAEGEAVGYEKGYTTGQQDAYDFFWDIYQQNGNRTDYKDAFVHPDWTIDNFKPKYNMYPTNAHSMFQKSIIPIDLQTTLEEACVVLDFMNCTTMEYAFRYSKLTRIGVVDARNCVTSDLRLVFADCPNLKTIDKIILRKDGSTKLVNSSFWWSPNIEEIRFEGKIGVNVDFQFQSKLTAESVQSIINGLKDFTGAATHTLTFHPKVGAKLTKEQKAVITAKNWTLVY